MKYVRYESCNESVHCWHLETRSMKARLATGGLVKMTQPRSSVRPTEAVLAASTGRQSLAIPVNPLVVGALAPRLCADQVSCLRPVADLKASYDLLHDAIGFRHTLV